MRSQQATLLICIASPEDTTTIHLIACDKNLETILDFVSLYSPNQIDSVF